MAPTIELKLSNQDQKIINYLADKDQVAWQELTQFSKIPTAVKRGTLLKVISDLRKKYTTVGLPIPFNCKFYDLNATTETIEVKTNASSSPISEAKVIAPSMVQMRKTLGGRMVRADNLTPDVHLDFEMNKARPFQVKTRNGWITLNESCFELFCIFYQNAGVPLSKEDLKNKVWPQWGSKLKSSWWDDLSGRMTKLRTNIPEIKTRISTIRINNDTFYMFK